MQSKLNFHPDHQNCNSLCCSRVAWLLMGDEGAHRAVALGGHQVLGLQKDPVSSHIFIQGEELWGCSPSRRLKAHKGQCCHTQTVHLLPKRCEGSQHLLQSAPPWGNIKVTLCLHSLNPVSPHPMPEQGSSYDPNQVFPYQYASHPHLGSLVWCTQTYQI